VLINYGTGFIIAWKVDEKFLGVESHLLMLVNWEKGSFPSHFLRNPTSSVISKQKGFLASLKLQVAKTIFF